MNRRVLIILCGLAAAALVGVLVLRQPESTQEPEVAAIQAEPPPTAPAQIDSAPSASSTPAAPRPTRRPPAVTEAPEPEAPVVEALPAPAVDVATLRISSDVPGAQVFIDRQFVGAAPVTAENVKPGSHQLNVSADGFEGIAQTIEVAPGARDITVRFKEVRLNARLSVVHKHRIGSCKGELIATAQGIRYETTDKDDAFSVALSDLEQFQVEYLDKTLRIKVRRGKQFNFTDPDAANADRLFVFHRDVDKARTQLGRGFSAAQ